MKIEKLIRTLSDLKRTGKGRGLVSSGAIAAGKAGSEAITSARTPWRKNRPLPLWGRARLMMMYPEALRGNTTRQPLRCFLQRDTMVNDASRYNAQNTFEGAF